MNDLVELAIPFDLRSMLKICLAWFVPSRGLRCGDEGFAL